MVKERRERKRTDGSLCMQVEIWNEAGPLLWREEVGSGLTLPSGVEVSGVFVSCDIWPFRRLLSLFQCAAVLTLEARVCASCLLYRT